MPSSNISFQVTVVPGRGTIDRTVPAGTTVRSVARSEGCTEHTCYVNGVQVGPEEQGRMDVVPGLDIIFSRGQKGNG